jgi:hypothetical protein
MEMRRLAVAGVAAHADYITAVHWPARDGRRVRLTEHRTERSAVVERRAVVIEEALRRKKRDRPCEIEVGVLRREAVVFDAYEDA